MINKYKIQLYFLEQLTELRKIKQVTQKKKEAVCQEEKELIRQKNFLVPNPNDSYSRKKFKNLVGMTIGDIAKAYNVKVIGTHQNKKSVYKFMFIHFQVGNKRFIYQ